MLQKEDARVKAAARIVAGGKYAGLKPTAIMRLFNEEEEQKRSSLRLTYSTARRALADAMGGLAPRQRVQKPAQWPPSGEAQFRIAFIASEFDDTFVGHLLRGIHAALPKRPGLESAKYQLLIGESRCNAARELELLAELGDSTAGIILIPVGRDVSDPAAVQACIERIKRPVLFVERQVQGLPDDVVPLVVSDNVRGGELAGEHLANVLRLRGAPANGRLRRQKVFAVVLDSSTGQTARLSGFTRALGAFRLLPTVIALQPDEKTPDEFMAGVARHVEQICRAVVDAKNNNDSRPYTGVFCGSDNIALATIAVLRANGLEVPADVAVVGFDDNHAAQMAGLTTIRQDFHAVGARAVQCLDRMIARQMTGRGDATLRELCAAAGDCLVRLAPDSLRVRATAPNDIENPYAWVRAITGPGDPPASA